MGWPATGSAPAPDLAPDLAPAPAPELAPEPAVPTFRTPTNRGLLAGFGLLLAWLGYRLVGGAAGPLSNLWAVDGVYLVALALATVEAPGRRLRAAGLNAAATTGGVVTGGLLAGSSPGQVAGGTLGSLVAAAVAVCAYHRLLWRLTGQAPSWVPRRATEAVWLLVAVVPAALVGAALGAAPGGGPGALGDPQQLLWCAARQLTILAVTVNCVLPVLFTPSRQLLPRPRWPHLPAFVLVAALGIGLPRVLPDQPLSWLLVVPAAYAGLAFPIRWAGLATMAVNLTITALPYQVFAAPPGAGLFSPQILTDLTQGFMAHVAMILAVFRETLMELRAEVAHRATAERTRREVLDGVVQSLTHGLVLTRPDGRVTLANQAAETLVGRLPERVTLDWVRQIDLQATDVNRVLDAEEVAAALQPTGLLSTHIAIPGGAGRTRRVALSSQRLDLGGDERLSLLQLRDVTAAHARQQELETFAGTVAHDLKSPLAALTGWMAAAARELDEGDPAAGLATLHRAQNAVVRMRLLIDDYLAYAVSRGGVITVTDIALDWLVRDIVDGYAGTHGSITVDCPHVVRADLSLTRQLLGHLIGNAVHHPRPGAPPEVAVTSVAAEPGWVQIRVADHGPGLPPGEADRLRAAFRGDTRVAGGSVAGSMAGSMAGLGLGLALCHAIATRHGGRIDAADNPWGGTTFAVTLPAEPEQP